MKLKDLVEFRAVPDFDRPDASRMTPVTFRHMAPPLPDEIYAQYEDEEEFPSVKTYTPEELAKKHGVSVEKIREQLKKGIEIEYEHTKDRAKSREIALDHLLELPDYYTRLKKMEHE